MFFNASLCHLLEDIFILSMATTVLIHVSNLTFTNLVWLHIWNHWSSSSAFPWSSISSLIPFMFDSTFTSDVIAFCFSVHFLLCWWKRVTSLFQLCIPVRCHMGFSWGDSTTICSAICVWTNRSTATSHPQTVKEVMRLGTDHNVHLLSGNDLWTEELAENLYFFQLQSLSHGH